MVFTPQLSLSLSLPPSLPPHLSPPTFPLASLPLYFHTSPLPPLPLPPSNSRSSLPLPHSYHSITLSLSRFGSQSHLCNPQPPTPALPRTGHPSSLANSLYSHSRSLHRSPSSFLPLPVPPSSYLTSPIASLHRSRSSLPIPLSLSLTLSRHR